MVEYKGKLNHSEMIQDVRMILEAIGKEEALQTKEHAYKKFTIPIYRGMISYDPVFVWVCDSYIAMQYGFDNRYS